MQLLPRPSPRARRLSPARRRLPPCTSLAASAFRDTRVTFQGVDGELLVGTLRRADAGADADADAKIARRPPPVVLLAHGYMSSRDSSVLARLADVLADGPGIASLRWDFSGNGDSEGRFRYGGYRREAREIGAAAFFAERELGLRVAALCGHSKGATSSIVYAGGGGGEGDDEDQGSNNNVASGSSSSSSSSGGPYLPPPPALRLVQLAGRFDVSEGVERRLGARVLEALRRDGRVDGMPGRRPNGGGGAFEWTLYAGDLEDRLSTDVGAYCAAVRRRRGLAGGGGARVLSLHCEGDAEVPVGEARRYHEALGGDAAGHRLVVIPGGDHSFRAEAAARALVEEAVAWCCGGAAADEGEDDDGGEEATPRS